VGKLRDSGYMDLGYLGFFKDIDMKKKGGFTTKGDMVFFSR
jgi:hypothetical protein